MLLLGVGVIKLIHERLHVLSRLHFVTAGQRTHTRTTRRLRRFSTRNIFICSGRADVRCVVHTPTESNTLIYLVQRTPDRLFILNKQDYAVCVTRISYGIRHSIKKHPGRPSGGRRSSFLRTFGKETRSLSHTHERIHEYKISVQDLSTCIAVHYLSTRPSEKRRWVGAHSTSGPGHVMTSTGSSIHGRAAHWAMLVGQLRTALCRAVRHCTQRTRACLRDLSFTLDALELAGRDDVTRLFPPSRAASPAAARRA